MTPPSKATPRGLALRLSIIVIGFAIASTCFGAEPEGSEPPSATVIEARTHFARGVSHFDHEEWAAALVEFFASRELIVTKGNTKNAAICLRKVGRFDEALQLFEALLGFPDLPAADREMAEHEVDDLASAVGTVELRHAPPGASVSIDGVERGTTPLPSPIRLSAGAHGIRVSKPGLLPFETKLDLSGKQALIVDARLTPITQAGLIRVTERRERSVAVVVGGVTVGTTPWEGALAPGVHTVYLRGAGALGTEPTQTRVKLDGLTELNLLAETLCCPLRIRATPESAMILLDGVPVARGFFEGRLRAGRHVVSVQLAGYPAATRALLLENAASQDVSLILRPKTSAKARVRLEADAGVPLGLFWGGDLTRACTGRCTATLPVGVRGVVRAAYSMPSRLGLGVHAGYLQLVHSLESRAASLYPVGRPANSGVLDDQLRLSGLMAGIDAEYAIGTPWTLTSRISMGALIGSLTDERSGTFLDSTGATYAVSTAQRSSADYLYVGPALHLGRKLGERFEIDMGIEVLLLAAVKRPTWEGRKAPVLASATEGLGSFADADLTAGVLVTAVPGISAKYEF